MPVEHQGEFGWADVWTWTAIDADIKLVPAWLVADHSSDERVIQRAPSPN